MDREPPPVSLSGAGPGGGPPDLLGSAEPPARRSRTALVLVLLAVVVLGAVAVRSRPPASDPTPAPVRPLPALPAGPGITASASLGGAATDEPDTQRLSLTVSLPAFDGRTGSGDRLLGDEVVLLGGRLVGFSVTTDDPRSPLPLGRFGRADVVRSTTVPLVVAVDACSIARQVQRRLEVFVQTGARPVATVRVEADADVGRALDRLLSRSCRRSQG